MSGPSERLSGHVVICNCNEKVRRLVTDLQRAAAPEPLDVVLLVQDAALWRGHPDWAPDPPPSEAGRFVVIEGCPSEEECLAEAHIEDALAAVILADPKQGELADARSTLVAMAIERKNPQVHTVIELIHSVNRTHLERTEVNEVVCLGDLAEKLLAQACISPGIVRVFDRLLDAAPDACRIHQVPVPDAAAGTPYRDLCRRAVRAGAPFVIVGFVLSHASPGERPVVLNPRAGDPGRDSVLGRGDQLLVIGREVPGARDCLLAPEPPRG